MPIPIDDMLLDELGFPSRTPAESRELAVSIYRELERPVALRIAASLSDDELDAFERLIDQDDPRGSDVALRWLDHHVPRHENFVREAFAELATAIRNRLERTVNP